MSVNNDTFIMSDNNLLVRGKKINFKKIIRLEVKHGMKKISLIYNNGLFFFFFSYGIFV